MGGCRGVRACVRACVSEPARAQGRRGRGWEGGEANNTRARTHHTRAPKTLLPPPPLTPAGHGRTLYVKEEFAPFKILLNCAPTPPLQGMDAYSNILYVKEEFATLSHLAHRCAAADKYRPETCCVIGNYYSLKARGGAGGGRCVGARLCVRS